jgi:hypothetical protein
MGSALRPWQVARSDHIPDHSNVALCFDGHMRLLDARVSLMSRVDGAKTIVTQIWVTFNRSPIFGLLKSNHPNVGDARYEQAESALKNQSSFTLYRELS